MHIYSANGTLSREGTTPVIYLFVLFQGRFVAACYVKPKKGFHRLTAWSQTVGGVHGSWQDHALRLERTLPFRNLACSCPLLAEFGRP